MAAEFGEEEPTRIPGPRSLKGPPQEACGRLPGVGRSNEGQRARSSRASSYLRWKSNRVGEATRRLAVFDVHADPRRSLYLASWQRSGSTWLAEIVASAPRTRLVYEPANVRQRFFLKGEPRLVALPPSSPGDDLGDDGAVLDRALRGTLMSSWANQLNDTRRPVRRVIKDIRTVPVLPWLVDRFPHTPVVLLVRHPVAVAHSLIQLGWTLNAESLLDPELAMRDPALVAELRRQTILQEVALWAEQHAWSMTRLSASQVHLVFYEDLRARPTEELNRLTAYLASFHPTWQDWEPDLASIARPSTTSYPSAGTERRETQRRWTDLVDDTLMDDVVRILRARGLDRLYGSDPAPLIAGEKALAAVRPSPPDGSLR